MPTWSAAHRFIKDLDSMTPEQRKAFKAAGEKFVADLEAEKGFRQGLRVKGIKGAKGVFEMTWAPDGRATFEYGEPVRNEEPHIVWRRVGSHDILSRP